MAANRVTEGLESRGDPVEQRPVLRGYVSTLRPAPTNFPEPGSEANLLWVVAPGYSLDRPLGPCWWNADHGATLPKQGNTVVVNFDDKGIPTVVSWEASRTPEPKPSLVSALPSEPTDGQEVYFQSTAMGEKGVVWHLRFRTASLEHKWEFVGGAALYAATAAVVGTESATYVALTGGPSITLPLAGDYEMGHFAGMEQSVATAICRATLKLGTAGAADTESFIFEAVNATGLGSGSKTMTRSGLATGAVVEMQYKQIFGGKATFGNREMWCRPVRVG